MRLTPNDTDAVPCAAEAPTHSLPPARADDVAPAVAELAGGATLDANVLMAAVDAVPHCVFIIGPDGRYVFQNAHDRALFGDLVGQPTNVGETLVDDVWLSAHKKALAGEDVRYVDVRQQGGEARSIETFMRPLAIGAERHGAVGISIDQTGLIEARNQLDQERQRLQDVLDSSSDLIWEQNEDFVFTHWHMPRQSAMRSPVVGVHPPLVELAPSF
jgi:PAS domain-containing protein